MELFRDQKYNYAKPFLRWAGGKIWLVEFLLQHLMKVDINNYFEPFIGGAAVFINLKQNNIINKVSYLSDQNSDLINLYKIIKEYLPELQKECTQFVNNEEFYYSIRKENFEDNIKRAAQFLYLNRTSYNGIYRVNLKGEYNVPYGFKKYSTLFDFNNLEAVSSLLQSSDLSVKDFEWVSESIKEKDLVFLDPPYTVAHENNGFVKYNQTIFSWDDQIRLKKLIMDLQSKGGYFIMTNACHSSIESLFDGVGTKFKLNRTSLIGGKNAIRGKVNELLYTNAF